MLKPPSSTKAPKIQRLSVEDWTNGVVTAFDDGRSPLRGLRSSENMILDQDSVITVRHGTAKYGPQPLGTVLGELAEFRSTTKDGSVNWYKRWFCKLASLSSKDKWQNKAMYS